MIKPAGEIKDASCSRCKTTFYYDADLWQHSPPRVCSSHRLKQQLSTRKYRGNEHVGKLRELFRGGDRNSSLLNPALRRLREWPFVHICLSLTAGVYRVAVFAKGLEIHRAMLELQPGITAEFKPLLRPDTRAAKSLNEALLRFGIGHIQTRDLEVPRNSTVVLDMQNDSYKPDWRTIEIRDVVSAKSIVGHSDDLWGTSNIPRYQPIALSAYTDPEQVARLAAQNTCAGTRPR